MLFALNVDSEVSVLACRLAQGLRRWGYPLRGPARAYGGPMRHPMGRHLTSTHDHEEILKRNGQIEPYPGEGFTWKIPAQERSVLPVFANLLRGGLIWIKGSCTQIALSSLRQLGRIRAMSQRNTISSISMTLAVGALLFAVAGSGPVWGQTAQQPATAPATAPPATTPGSASMPMSMQQMQQGHGMMGGQGTTEAPMGSMRSCPGGQMASGNPPTCK